MVRKDDMAYAAIDYFAKALVYCLFSALSLVFPVQPEQRPRITDRKIPLEIFLP